MALSHPLRRDILRALDGEPTSPRQVTTRLEETLSNVAYHFTVLEKAGVIKLVRTRPVRGSTEHFYTVGPLPDWAEKLLAARG